MPKRPTKTKASNQLINLYDNIIFFAESQRVAQASLDTGSSIQKSIRVLKAYQRNYNSKTRASKEADKIKLAIESALNHLETANRTISELIPKYLQQIDKQEKKNQK